ncbi:acyl carrier protein [Myxococcus sp. K15C18031901]|uniref:acyl carrier protein n=1 Tax=Myxococcus dinghuensis TaxID=2906761 RepID=UPI0020A82F53|nr:acyl carrier protein [Myxococcus dinghuensis]MCP3102833.1 acyl carrier protein [Myxococcus dinghuensis]
MNQAQLLEGLTRYIADEILEGDAEDLLPSTPLLELGILNSLETARMVGFIEKQYGITVPADALRVENLQTLSAIADMVYACARDHRP